MNTGIPLRARILGVLRNRCTCLTSRERSDMADDLCRAAEIDRAALEAERDRLREAIDDYLAHEDNHQPGEIVETGYGKEQLCTEDEACRRANYWPCPTERLRRARVALDSEGGET